MAKAATAEAPKNELAKTTTNLPAGMAAQLKADAGLGYRNVTQDDKIIPFVAIAQKMNPELDERDSQHIRGLKEGDFFSKATGKIWPGMSGFSFVPVMFQKKFLEWVPREKGGGFAGEHGPEIMTKVTSEERGGKFGNWLPNGNTVAVTATWYGMIIDKDTGDVEQAVLALAATQLKKSKQLMSKLDTVKIEVDGQRFNPAMFYNVVDMTTRPEKNDKGSWYGWNPALAGSVLEIPGGSELYATGKAFLEAVESGAVKAETPMTDVSDGSSGGGDDKL